MPGKILQDRYEKIYSLKPNIIEEYKKCYSVTEVLTNLNWPKTYRSCVERILKEEEGLYQGCGGKSALYKQSKIRQAVFEKYGVDNITKHHQSGYTIQNKIPYTKPKIFVEFKKYRKEVERITNINKKKLIDSGYCYYTGIKFADSDGKTVNPNDPLKRTIDHKIPIIFGYINDIKPSEISSVSNLVFCLRLCNNIKASTNFKDFLPIAKFIRQSLIDENYQSN